MNFVKKLFNKTERQINTIPKGWRVGMWVVDEANKPAIIYSMVPDSIVIHYINKNTGETVEQQTVSYTSVRQAKFGEIPECRRMITKEKAEALGYGA